MFANLFDLSFSASPVSSVWEAWQAYPSNTDSVSVGREARGVSVVQERLIQTGRQQTELTHDQHEALALKGEVPPPPLSRIELLLICRSSVIFLLLLSS